MNLTARSPAEVPVGCDLKKLQPLAGLGLLRLFYSMTDCLAPAEAFSGSNLNAGVHSKKVPFR